MGKVGGLLLTLILCALLVTPVIGAAEEGQPTSTQLKTESQIVEQLGLLIGEGSGVTAAYLAKNSTRIQAAIISLRLQGKLQEALAYEGSESFSDAHLVGNKIIPVLAYLKSHPEYGWSGAGGGKFDPLSPISSQQLYKVLLESMGYKTGAEFEYVNTEQFAKSKGLKQIEGMKGLNNGHIATALVEALYTNTANGISMLDKLKENGVIPKSTALPQRIGLNIDTKLGTYITDGEGNTLYLFTKDKGNLESCMGQCITNWPLFTSDQLLIPGSLHAADFTILTRSDSSKQWMYKGWPLYYFVKDEAPGDIKGQNVNDVWFVIDPAKVTDTTSDVSVNTYNVKIRDFSFGSEPLTVEAGSTIVFTNFDDMKHNAVAVDGSFSTPLLDKGESASITLEKPGTYDYFCEPHKTFMTGQIIVK